MTGEKPWLSDPGKSCHGYPGRLRTMPVLDVRLLREIRELGVSRGEMAWILGLTALFAVLEGAGIGLLLPVLHVVEQGEPSSRVSAMLSSFARSLGAETPAAQLAVLLLIAFLPLALRSAVQYARDLFAGRLKFRVAAVVRSRAAESFLFADKGFYLKHDRGELYAALTGEAERAAEALATRLVFLAALAMFLAYTGLLFLVAPCLAAVAGPAFLLVGFVFRRQSIANRGHSDALSALHMEFGQQISNRFQGVDRIKMRGWERPVSKEIGGTAESIAGRLLSIERLRLLVEMTMHPLVVMAAFASVYVAVILLNMTLASLGLFLFIMVRLVPQLTLMNTIWAHMHGFMGSQRRLEGLVAEAEAHREVTDRGRPAPGLCESVTLENVSFRYPTADESAYALRDVNCRFAKGTLTAVVGRSGAGKSTLANLLAGFFLPALGRVLYDHVPVEELSLHSLRRRVALVPQEPFLFNDTVRANLLFGVDDAPGEDALRKVLDRACCSDFLNELEHGLETVVGERGVRLSQGQRQRVAIAHALACASDILILDEPTSALDSESERAIQQTLARLHGEITIIVIAHRLSTIREADQILVMEEGCVVAQGRHQDLLETSPLYRRLFETQIFS